MNFYIIHTGESKESYWTAAFEEYKKRMSAPHKLYDIALKPERLPSEPSEAQIIKALEKEADTIEQTLKKMSLSGSDTQRIALCIEGKSMTSESFARYIELCGVNGKSNAVFIIGSSFGLSDNIKKGSFSLSFSPMTFPHQMAKVMLAEQIYRAASILKGSKYHK